MRKDPLQTPNLRFSFLTPSEAVFFTSTFYKDFIFLYSSIQEKESMVPDHQEKTNDQQSLDWDYQLWHYIVLFSLAIILTIGFLYLKRFKR